MEKFPDTKSMYFALVMVLITCNAVKIPDLDETTLYLLFLGQIFFIGLAFNLYFVISANYTNPKFATTSFELNMCSGQLMTLASPILAKLPEPTPTLVYWFCIFLAMFMTYRVSQTRAPKAQTVFAEIEKSVLSIIKDEGNSESFRGNLSSVLVDTKTLKKRALDLWQQEKKGHDDDEDSD